jgi:hypothetical protein
MQDDHDVDCNVIRTIGDMYIVLQKPGDTMVLDSVRGHRRTHESLTAFSGIAAGLD